MKKEKGTMKQLFKKMAVIFLMGVIAFSVIPTTVQAAGWKQNKNGYWWQENDYSYPKNQWKTIYGKQYHFNSDGYMDTGWKKIDGKWYYLGSRNDGAKKTYWQKVYGKYYWLGRDGAMRTGWQKVYGKYYWLGHSNDGAMKTGWQKVYGKYYWLGHSNDGAMKTGWQTVYGKKYYLGGANDGAMKTGWQQIDGYWYYFGGADDGSLKTNTWIGNYHVDASGKWDKSKNQGTVKYLGDEIKSYEKGWGCREFNGEPYYAFFDLGGISYQKGFTLGASNGEGYISYNLEGKYNYISGIVGNVDGVACNVTYVVIGDEKLIGTIEVKEAEPPIEFGFNIRGVKKLTIIADNDGTDGGKSGFANVIVYNNKADKPNLFGTATLASKAYLGKDIKSYNHSSSWGSYWGFNGNEDEFFKLGGVIYRKGFTIETEKYWGFTNYNLEGKYNYLSGVAGNIDGVNYSVVYRVVGDGKLLGKINIKGGGLPVSFEFNVSGIKRLTIQAEGDESYYNGVGFGNVVVYKNKADKPQIFETVNLPSSGYLGSEILSYTSENYKGYNLSLSFKMGGTAYRKGFTLQSYKESYANFNIDGRYNYLSGVAGNVDGNKSTVTYSVIGDGKLLGTITIKSGSSPKAFTFNISNVKQLSFVSQGSTSGDSSCMNGFGNIMVYSGNKPKTFSIDEPSEELNVEHEYSEEIESKEMESTESEEIETEDDAIEAETDKETEDLEEADKQQIANEQTTDSVEENTEETDVDRELEGEQADTNQDEQENPKIE